MKSMSQTVAEFQRSETFRRLARSTQKRQMISINRLLNELPGSRPVSQLSRIHIDGVLSQARDNGVLESSLNVYRTDIRRFCKWLVVYGYVKIDHSTHLENVRARTAPSIRKPISADQAREMIRLAEERHPRDGVTILLFLVTALRENEIVNLRWRHLYMEKPRVNRNKTRDHHPVFVNGQLKDRLVDWQQYVVDRHGEIDLDWYVVPALAHRHDKTGHHRMNPDWPLMPTRPQTNISKRVKMWLAAVGETDLHWRASHTLRRTAGNLFKASGASMRETQVLFGHATEQQTADYLDIDPEQTQVQVRMRDFRI